MNLRPTSYPYPNRGNAIQDIHALLPKHCTRYTPTLNSMDKPRKSTWGVHIIGWLIATFMVALTVWSLIILNHYIRH